MNLCLRPQENPLDPLLSQDDIIKVQSTTDLGRQLRRTLSIRMGPPLFSLLVGLTLVLQQTSANVVQMRFDITDVAGTPIDSINVGEDFRLNVFLEDIRAESVSDRGVFASFLDVLYEASLISVTGPLDYGPDYRFDSEGDHNFTPGKINDAGNVQTDAGFGGPKGPDEFLFFTVPLRGDAPSVAGPTVLRGVAAENSPATDVFIFTDAFNPVLPEDIIYGSDGLTIINGCDFNSDLTCDLADINLMFQLGDLVTGEATSAPTEIFDLVEDNVIDPRDVTEWLARSAIQNGYASSYLRGDVDGLFSTAPETRDVDITDFNILAVNFTNPVDGDPTNGPFWHHGNFDGDDDVDITDFNFLAVAFQGGDYSSLTVIPEPSSALLWLLGLPGFLLIARHLTRTRQRAAEK